MKNIRKFLSNLLFIHALLLLGLFALWGYIETNNKYILLGLAMSFSGAICGAFARTLDIIRSR